MFNDTTLTEMERACITQLLLGNSNKAIAEVLNMKPVSVNHALMRSYEKLEIGNGVGSRGLLPILCEIINRQGKELIRRQAVIDEQDKAIKSAAGKVLEPLEPAFATA